MTDRITTKGGDGGDSALYSGERRRKSDETFEALGALDELNSWLGVIKLRLPKPDSRQELEQVQRVLFRICSNLATTLDAPVRAQLDLPGPSDLEALESWQQRLMGETELPDRFIIPGEQADAAWADVARTVCRRAERAMVRLLDQRPERLDHCRWDLKYVNRLSDVLYILARRFEEGAFREK